MDSYDEVRQLGRIVGIWAHPDDETWASAGLMKIATDNGQVVELIMATDGAQGGSCDESKWPSVSLGDTRRAELQQAMSHMGRRIRLHWLGYDDGAMRQADVRSAVSRIYSILQEVQPDTIITFEQNGITGHDDHKTIHSWAMLAAKRYGKAQVLQAVESQQKYDTASRALDDEFDIYFNTETPRLIDESYAALCLHLNKDTLQTKKACLQAHASQTDKLLRGADQKLVDAMLSTECYI
jgi:LmbE family N-acetylglucosaminyl deacetylase